MDLQAIAVIANLVFFFSTLKTIRNLPQIVCFEQSIDAQSSIKKINKLVQC